MSLRFVAYLLLLFWATPDGDDEGRRGNEFFEQQQYALAIESYERGLAALSEDAPRLLRYGLLNNLGAALLKSGDAESAGEAFARALNAAPETGGFARTAYNAGNAAYASQDLEAAVEHYRESLLADPTNEDAKFNYEFVKRRQEQQQQQQQDDQQGDDEQEDQDQQDGEQDNEEQEQDGRQDQEQDGSQQNQEEAPADEQDERESQQQPQPSQELSEEQAEQILQALQNEEEQLLREVQRPKSRPRQVEKDW